MIVGAGDAWEDVSCGAQKLLHPHVWQKDSFAMWGSKTQCFCLLFRSQWALLSEMWT